MPRRAGGGARGAWHGGQNGQMRPAGPDPEPASDGGPQPSGESGEIGTQVGVGRPLAAGHSRSVVLQCSGVFALLERLLSHDQYLCSTALARLGQTRSGAISMAGDASPRPPSRAAATVHGLLTVRRPSHQEANGRSAAERRARPHHVECLLEHPHRDACGETDPQVTPSGLRIARDDRLPGRNGRPTARQIKPRRAPSP